MQNSPEQNSTDQNSRGQDSPADNPQPPGLSPDQMEELQGLFELARGGDELLLRYLDAGVPVNLTNSAGDTLLILAVYHRQAPMVGHLLARGADVERENDRGQTALGCAVFRQDAELVSMLLAAGADPDAGSRTAREVASFFALDEMAALLPPPR